MDWNNDGKKDLVVGVEDRQIRVYLNSGTNSAPLFNNFTVAVSNASQLYRCSPEVYDLNMDGKKDLIAGENGGYVYYYENIGSDSAPTFNSTGIRLKLKNGADLKVPGGGAHIELADWDRNGSLDLIIGDSDAKTYVFTNPSGDADDPSHPANVAAYSDHTTPNSMALSWTDPTTLYIGTPISPADFTIEIQRDGAFLASVPGGAEQYTDAGLVDGQVYEYQFNTKLVANDSTSMPVFVSWHAGGSPIPEAPANLTAVGTLTQADLSWVDPATQEDGTPLDDLDHLEIFRNGVFLANVAPGVQSYQDNPAPGYTYDYTVVAVDNESPANFSAASNTTSAWIGDTPKMLVWVGPDAVAASAASGDSLFNALMQLGESVFITNNLFEFGNNLSIFDAIFVVLGIYSNNHVLKAADPEGPALQSYLQNGGRIYLEGGDCFYYDPASAGGYNINPWFSCNPLGDGGSDVSGIIGLNSLSAFSFSYSGENSYMDELAAIGSVTIWQNSANADIHGLFNPSFGDGRAIGVVPSFGGFDNSTDALTSKPRLAEIPSLLNRQQMQVKPKVPGKREVQKPFVKRYGFVPENKVNRKQLSELAEFTAGGVRILANNKVDLMAAYLGFFGFDPLAPVMTMSTTSCCDTVEVGGTAQQTVTITNAGIALANDLIYSVNIDPAVSWMSATPLTDTLSAGASGDIYINLDAAGLAIGNHSAYVHISSNDPNHSLDSIEVILTVINPIGIEDIGGVLPTEFAVAQNYPNPFNPATVIPYQLPLTSDVSLVIYNMLGQKVRTMVKEKVAAGYHQISWDGLNDFGEQVSAGVYIYRFSAGTHVEMKKMLLLK